MREEIFRKKVLPLFGISLIIMAIGIALASNLDFLYHKIGFIILCIIEIVTIGIAIILKRKEPWNRIALFTFDFITGITTAPLVYLTLSIDAIALIEAFIISSVFFFSLVLYSLISKKDFRSWGGILMALLLSILMGSVMNMFLFKSYTINIIIDIVTILVFFGMILYDMSRILRDYNDEDYTAATLALYIDFLNIFVRVLSFLLREREKE